MMISHVYKSPNYEARPVGAKITLLCLHATVGTAQSALGWLCNPKSKVSIHYLIDKAGTIYQLVSDDRVAYHAGRSSWHGAPDCNTYSIGVELENANTGRDPYPESQLASLRWLTAQLWRDHSTLRDVATHAEVAEPPGRKSDPVGFPIESFRVWVASLLPAPASPYTERSPILSPVTHAPIHIAPVEKSHYNQLEINQFVARYEEIAISVGIDPTLAIAQMLHETGWLTSWWCERPRRNPAGIGVNGDVRVSNSQPGTEWSKHPDGTWHAGLSYRTWLNDSIPDHIGRLLCYLLPAGTGTDLQQKLVRRSNARRLFPLVARGTVQVLKQLGRVHNESGLGWADPGGTYGAKIAEIANQLKG